VMADHMRNPVIQKAMAKLLHEGALQWPLAGEISDFEKRIYGHHFPKHEEVQGISALIKRLPAENTEDILSRSLNVINRISFAINAMFCDINWNVNWASLDKFLSSQMAQKETRHTFLSFNYDLLLDSRVQKISPEFGLIWNPLDGYGFVADGLADSQGDIEPTLPECSDITELQRRLEKRSGSNLQVASTIRILKPHGSLNWVVPFSGNYEFDVSPVAIIVGEENKIAYRSEFDIFDDGYWGIFVIPPVPPKESSQRFIQRTLDDEKEALKEADDVYILGWSMPKTDRKQVSLIREAVEQRGGKPFDKITVINFGAEVEYFERVASVFGVNQGDLRVFNAGFCDFVQTL